MERERDKSPKRNTKRCDFCKEVHKARYTYSGSEICCACMVKIGAWLGNPGTGPVISCDPDKCPAPNLKAYNSCKLCRTSRCVNIAMGYSLANLNKRCCECDNRNRGRPGTELCTACLRERVRLMQWRLTYLFISWKCDMPILESLFFSERVISMRYYDTSFYDQILNRLRRIEYRLFEDDKSTWPEIPPAVWIEDEGNCERIAAAFSERIRWFNNCIVSTAKTVHEEFLLLYSGHLLETVKHFIRTLICLHTWGKPLIQHLLDALSNAGSICFVTGDFGLMYFRKNLTLWLSLEYHISMIETLPTGL